MIDKETGQIVAKAGKEVRLYQRAEQARSAVNQIRTQAAAMESDLRGRLERAVGIGMELQNTIERMHAQQTQLRQFGLAPQELLEAAQYASMAKTQPVEALKKLLTLAASRGIDLSQVAQGLSSGGDTKALMDMVRQEMAQHFRPMHERTAREKQHAQQQQQRMEALRQTKSHINQFFAANPDAYQFLPVFDAVLQRFPQMTLGEIWAKLQLHIVQRRRNGRLPRNRTRLNGGGMPGGRGNIPTSQGSNIAPVNMRYEDIAKQVLDEAGYR